MKIRRYQFQGRLLQCPYCWQVQNALSGDTRPKDGDISICIECANPSIIDIKNGVISLRKPKAGEESEICQDTLARLIGDS